MSVQAKGLALAAGLSFGMVFVQPALAAPEEIQVYMDEMNAPGHFGLDVHNNYVTQGDIAPAYPGEQQSVHRLRITPEFSYGLTPNIELGGYLPLATIDHNGHFNVAGEKARIKFIAPKAEGQTWFWGANFEIGRVQRRLDINPWNAELKGIVGKRAGPWTLAMNTNFDWAVSGPDKGPTTLEIATKVSYAVSPKLAFGMENFNGLGELKHLGRLSRNEQAIYATIDASAGRWDFDFGVGHGYGQNPDHWILKAIVSVPIDARD